MKSNLLYLIIILSFFSCQKENFDENSSNFNVPNRDGTIRTTEEIKSLVVDLLGNASSHQRSASHAIEISDIEISALTSEIIGESNTKNDTFLFIVKERNVDHSVIVSANRKCEPIVAILDNPNLTIDDLILDTTDDLNPIMPILFSAIEYNKNPNSFDEFENITRQNSTASYRRAASVVKEISPRVKVQWGQSEDPYNRYTPNRWHAGCVATVVAQALSVTKHLNSFNGINLNWTNLVKMVNSGYRLSYPNEANTIGALMHQIGLAVGMKYGASGSSANTEKALKTFFSGGLNPYFVNPSNGAIELSLNEHPSNVTVISSRTKKPNLFGVQQGDGHAYIVDGYRESIFGRL